MVNTGVELPRLSLYHTDFLMHISSSFNNPSSIYTHTHKKQKKKEKERKRSSHTQETPNVLVLVSVMLIIFYKAVQVISNKK